MTKQSTGGIGGTLAGNALSLAATRATLEHVLTDRAFERMIALGERFEAGVLGAIRRYQLPWIVKRLGCRVEYWFRRVRVLLVGCIIMRVGVSWVVFPARLSDTETISINHGSHHFPLTHPANPQPLSPPANAQPPPANPNPSPLLPPTHTHDADRPTPPRNGAEAAAALDADLDRYMHLAALNRGILLTPFHAMALMCPATTEADVDRHTIVFTECLELLLGPRGPSVASSASSKL